MDINEIPFVLELTEQQRQLLLHLIVQMPISGSLGEVALTVETLRPVMEQLKGVADDRPTLSNNY